MDSHVGRTAIKGRSFQEIAKVVKSGHSNYNDILELFNVGTSIPDEEEDTEVINLLCDVLDSKISLPVNFIDKLKLDVCDWYGMCMPSLFSTKKWKRDLALKLIGGLQKAIGNVEFSLQVRWEALRNTMLRHIDSLVDLVCERDKHWFDIWIVSIDILGKKLALNSNRPLLNKLFKVLSPFKEDFQKFPRLQLAVREVPFKLFTVTCWQKVVDYWLQGSSEIPLNHVMTIIRFFKRVDSEPPVVRAKCLCLWRVVCLLPPGHKGLQPSMDQLFAIMLNQNTSKAASKGPAVPGLSSLELVPDLLSEMLALMLGANLSPDHELVVSSELFLPTYDLIGSSSMFLQKIFQCFEKLLLINPVKDAIKPNALAIKTGFSCFLSKLNSNPSYELINSVLKLPQNILAQAHDNIAILNNCIDVVVRGIVCGSHCFGDNIMTSSKYYSGPSDLMTGSPTLMLTRYLLDKTKLELLDLDTVLSILEALIPKGTTTVHYILRFLSILKSLCTYESVAFVSILKVWQILVVSINTQYCSEADFTRETPDLGWIYSVILFPLCNFHDQYWVETLSYVGSKHHSELLSKLLTNNTHAENAIVTCEAIALKLDRLLSTANDLCLPAIATVTRVLVTSTPYSKFPRGKRYLKSTFTLVTNLLNLKCVTEGHALELIKIIEALSVCLDGDLPTLLKLTSLVDKLLRLPSQNKCVTDSALITSLLFIETAEKEYANNSLPSVNKLKAAYQYCQTVAKTEESRSLTPKRCPTVNGGLSPALARRITPKRVGPSPTSATVDATNAKSLQASPRMSPFLDSRASEPANESSIKLEPPKKSAALSRPRGPLTKHQREKMRERQDNIPALYLDLTQESQAVGESQPEFTQDSSSLVVPQRFRVSSATLEVQESNVESRPFASVVQEPEAITIDSDAAVQKEQKKAIYEIFRKNKKDALQPIHLRKVHAPSEAKLLIESIKPDESVAVLQDRPFKAFSPASKNKCELFQSPTTKSISPGHAIARKCLLPETDFSQDFVADSQMAETQPPLVFDDAIAMFPTEVNSPVKLPDQRKEKTPERNSHARTSKRKSLKRRMSNNFEDPEPSQQCKKQNVTNPGKAAAKKNTADPGCVDESSNNSTDSNMSASRKSKRNELVRLCSNLVMNESPLPLKRARRVPAKQASNIEDNSNATAEKPSNSKKSRKSQLLNNSDCDSVTSDTSSLSDISIPKKRTRRSRLILAAEKEGIPEKIDSKLEEPQQPLKLIAELKTRSSIGKKRAIEPVQPISEGPSQNDVAVKQTVVKVINHEPVSTTTTKKSQKKKTFKDPDFTKNLVPTSIEKVNLEEDSQNLVAKEPVLPTSSIAAPSNTLQLKDNFVENIASEKKNENFPNNAVPHPEEMLSATPVVNEDKKKNHPPIVCLDSDVEGSDSETSKNLLVNKIRLGSDVKPVGECLNFVSNKENKIVEESQDSIIPCSQSDTEDFKSLVTKRKNYRPKILSRSSSKSTLKSSVLSPVLVVPETQILDSESPTEKTSSVIPNPTQEAVAEACNSIDSTEQQSKNSDLALAENHPSLSSEKEMNTSSNTDVKILLPEVQELEGCTTYVVEQVVETTVNAQEGYESTNSLPSEEASATTNKPENESGKDMQSPPRPGPKVMENLSPSMLRLLNCNHTQKSSSLEPTCRSKKMLQMVLPFVSDTNMKNGNVKPQVEKEEACIYIDQTFPAQECLVGEDGTPVLRDWKKCVPSPSLVPARSSLKSSVKKNEHGKNRKLCFPFEPTTKVLFYYEKKNSKCNENISQIKIKKQLRKKRKTLRDQKAMADSEKEIDQSMAPNAGIKEYTSCIPIPTVLPSNDLSLTESNLSPSSLNDSHLPVGELISLPGLQIAAEESVPLHPVISSLPDSLTSPETVQSSLPVNETPFTAELSKEEQCDPIKADSAEPTTYLGDTPMFSTPPQMVSPEKQAVIPSDTLLTEKGPRSSPAQTSEPSAIPNRQAETATLFEDSYHDYATPTPLSLPDPELLNGTDPLYGDLVDCQQPITIIMPSLTTPQWQDDLSKVLAERNILTVGDFCKRTERQIDLLPIKENKVKTAMKALDKYKLQLQIADACSKDLLKGLECNKNSKQVFNQLYPVTKKAVGTMETQTCSEIEDPMHDNFVRNASSDRLVSSLQESGKLSDDSFVEKLVMNIEPQKYISMHCHSRSVDDLSLELANSINKLPVEERMRHINTLLSHLKFKD